jgi:hypothetical protein
LKPLALKKHQDALAWMQHSQLFIWFRKSNKDFSYTTFPVKKNKRWKKFKIIRKSLFNYSFYSHPEIGNFRVWHCSKLKLQIEKDPSPTHRAIHNYGGAKNKFGFVLDFFLTLNLENEDLITFITRVFW